MITVGLWRPHGQFTLLLLNFGEENFCDQQSNHEIYENIVPRKFGATCTCIRYLGSCENDLLDTIGINSTDH